MACGMIRIDRLQCISRLAATTSKTSTTPIEWRHNRVLKACSVLSPPLSSLLCSVAATFGCAKATAGGADRRRSAASSWLWAPHVLLPLAVRDHRLDFFVLHLLHHDGVTIFSRLHADATRVRSNRVADAPGRDRARLRGGRGRAAGRSSACGAEAGGVPPPSDDFDCTLLENPCQSYRGRLTSFVSLARCR